MRKSRNFAGACPEIAMDASTPGRAIMNEFVWKKHEYTKKHSRRPEDTRYVMVIYSGGTLGMKYAPDQGDVSTAFSTNSRACFATLGYIPVAQYLEKKMRTYPMFHDLDYPISQDTVAAFSPNTPMALP